MKRFFIFSQPSEYVYENLLSENFRVNKIVVLFNILFCFIVFFKNIYLRLSGNLDNVALFWALIFVCIADITYSIICMTVFRKVFSKPLSNISSFINPALMIFNTGLLLFAVFVEILFRYGNINSMMVLITMLWVFCLAAIPHIVLILQLSIFFMGYSLLTTLLFPFSSINYIGNFALYITFLAMGLTRYRMLREKIEMEESEKALALLNENIKWKESGKYNQELHYFEAVEDKQLIAKGHFDLTGNRVILYQSYQITHRDYSKFSTFDENFGDYKSVATRESDYPMLDKMSNRQVLINDFEKGRNSYSITFPAKVEPKTVTWVRLDYHLYRVPDNGHIELFAYLIDSGREYLEQLMLSRLSNFGITALGYIDATYGKSSLYFYQAQGGNIHMNMDYAERIKILEVSGIDTSQADDYIKQTELSTIVENLKNNNGSYNIRVGSTSETIMQIEFCWLDEASNMILYMMSNITAQVELETRHELDLRRTNAMRRAISDSFVSLYHVDIVKNTIEKVNLDPDSDSLTSEPRDIFKTIGELEKAHLDPETIRENKEFWYVPSFENRLKGRDFLTHDVKTKTRGWVQLNILPYKYDKKGHLTEILWLIRTIDDEKKHELEQQEALRLANKAALAANRAKSTFLSNMSHDIRTPMNAVIGFAEIALAHLNDRERVTDSLHKILVSGNHLQQLINDILDMSHIESGKLSVREEYCDLFQVTERITSIIYPQASAKHLDFTINTEEVEHNYIYADTLKLNQILINLLNNAVKFTEEGGFVSLKIEEYLSSEPDHAGYRFIVEDNGIGMSEDFLSRVFQPFERESTATVSGIEGSGLGLSITNNLVELMNGTLFVESSEGKGSKFTATIQFRLADEDEIKDYKDKNEEDDDIDREIFTGKRVLIVEDNELNREIAELILKESGFLTECACDGTQAIEMLDHSSMGYYDLVLMDIQMPVMDGYEATGNLRASEREDISSIPIIAMTANAFDEDKNRATASGMNDHISKPIDRKVLLKTLKKYF